MTKSLAILITVIAVTEALLMGLLQTIDEGQFGPWIPALFDATAVSLAAILTINRMLQHSLVSLREDGRGEFIQLKIGAIVFTFEAIVMLVLYLSPLTLTSWQEGLFDVIALTLGSSLVIYGIVLKPASEEKLDSGERETQFDPTIATNILGYACLMILLLMALISTYEQQLQQRSLEIKQQETKELELAKVAFLNQLYHAANDILIMANQNDLQEFIHGNKRAIYELQKDYKNIAKVKNYYAQLRFIDNKGMEVIRVQRDGSLIHITPQEQLQNKSDRYYFKEGIRLSPGEVYLSPLDLNVEHGEVEQPINPMIRLTTPVIDRYGNKTGAIVLNLNGNHLLKELENANETTLGQLMLINEEGYWLFGSEPERLWGFMFQEKLEQLFQRWYPETWAKIEHIEHGTSHTDEGIFLLETIELSPDQVFANHVEKHADKAHVRHWPVWKLMSHISTNLISDQMQKIRNLMILLYISALLLAAVGAAMLTQAMLKRRQAERKIRQLALYDSLTGLDNRRLFNEKVRLEIAHALRHENTMALMYLDLDHFKPINDELGHDVGDAALQEVAERLKNCLRNGDTASRLGGDEFAILLPRAGSDEDIGTVAQRIIDKISEPFHLLGHTCQLGISIGIAILTEADETPLSLSKRADHAMYEAKHSGRNCYRFAPCATGLLMTTPINH